MLCKMCFDTWNIIERILVRKHHQYWCFILFADWELFPCIASIDNCHHLQSDVNSVQNCWMLMKEKLLSPEKLVWCLWTLSFITMVYCIQIALKTLVFFNFKLYFCQHVHYLFSYAIKFIKLLGLIQAINFFCFFIRQFFMLYVSLVRMKCVCLEFLYQNWLQQTRKCPEKVLYRMLQHVLKNHN
jgi:hypothetical protein